MAQSRAGTCRIDDASTVVESSMTLKNCVPCEFVGSTCSSVTGLSFDEGGSVGQDSFRSNEFALHDQAGAFLDDNHCGDDNNGASGSALFYPIRRKSSESEFLSITRQKSFERAVEGSARAFTATSHPLRKRDKVKAFFRRASRCLLPDEDDAPAEVDKWEIMAMCVTLR